MTIEYGFGPCGLGGYYRENEKIVMFVHDPEILPRKKKPGRKPKI